LKSDYLRCDNDISTLKVATRKSSPFPHGRSLALKLANRKAKEPRWTTVSGACDGDVVA